MISIQNTLAVLLRCLFFVIVELRIYKNFTCRCGLAEKIKGQVKAENMKEAEQGKAILFIAQS